MKFCRNVVGLLLLSLATACAEPAAVIVLCAAGIRPPVESAAKKFQEETGIPIRLQYAGSGALLSTLRISKVGDLYITADDSYVELGKKYELLGETFPLAIQVPVIAVHKGNPKGIRSIKDLLRKDVRFALGIPDAVSIGRTTKEILDKEGLWKTYETHARVFKPTVNEIANDVKIGTVDAGIVWDSTVGLYDTIEMVRDPLLDTCSENVSACMLKCAKNPNGALAFARWLADPAKGQIEFKKFRFTPAQP